MAIAPVQTRSRPVDPPASPPPLEPGDHLSRPEFERRYAAMPDLKKAELLEGTVYMPSPVKLRGHGRPHSILIGLCERYALATPGVEIADNTSMRLDLANAPQPDIVMFLDPARGGQARIDDEDYLNGAPELILEVAASSRSYDLHVKREVYRRHGVREYVVFRVQDGAVDWFALEDGDFVPLAADAAGRLRSRIFPGFCLDQAALVAGDRHALAAALDAALAARDEA